ALAVAAPPASRRTRPGPVLWASRPDGAGGLVPAAAAWRGRGGLPGAAGPRGAGGGGGGGGGRRNRAGRAGGRRGRGAARRAAGAERPPQEAVDVGLLLLDLGPEFGDRREEFLVHPP